MQFSRKPLEASTFATFAAVTNFGLVTLGPKTVTAFNIRLGGLVPAFFTLIPYSFISLGLLYWLLRSLSNQGEREARSPAAAGV